MTFDRFGDQSTEGTLASDMNRARGYRPITQEDLTKAYSQYNAVGLKFGTVKKADSDTALYNKAKKFVLDWWKKEKADAAAAAGGSGAGSTTGGMPDTAMGQGGTPFNLPSISDSRSAPTYANIREGGGQAPAVAPLTAAQVSATLKQMGAPVTWNPPAYARTSPEALKAWVQRAATNSKITLANNYIPAFTDSYITGVIKNLNIIGVSAASVPTAYRTNDTALKNYLLQLQAAYKMRVAARLLYDKLNPQ